MTASSEDAKPRCGHKKPEGKHWLEYAIFVFVVATALATTAAAYYTRRQWLTGQDTEQRQLRAYVDVMPTDETSFLANAPASVGFVVKNDGQTPAFEVVAKHALFTHSLRRKAHLSRALKPKTVRISSKT